MQGKLRKFNSPLHKYSKVKHLQIYITVKNFMNHYLAMIENITPIFNSSVQRRTASNDLISKNSHCLELADSLRMHQHITPAFKCL